MKKLLVTGGTGFIGSHLIKCLEQNEEYVVYVFSRHEHDDYENVHFIAGDVLDVRMISRVISAIKPDILVHFAWAVGSSNYAEDKNNKIWFEASVRLLDVFLQNGGTKVVVSGTCYEYDFSHGENLSGNMASQAVTLYGQTKKQLYEVYSKLCKDKAKLIWGRIFFPYGKGEIERKLFTAVITALQDNQYFVCKTPNNVVDYIHVKDIAAIFNEFITTDKYNGIVNVGTGIGYKVKDILQRIGRVMGKECYLSFEENQKHTRIVADTHKLEGYQYLYNIDTGIQSYF